MTNFNHNKITTNKDLIASELRSAREERKKSINDVSKDLGIKKEYIEALERSEYEKLPQGVYGKNYLREYGRYLRLDEKKLLELYDDDFKEKEKNRQSKVFSRKIPKAHLFLIVPRILKNIILVLVVVVCLSYLGFYVNNIIKPPKLEIFYPQKDIMIEKNTILVSGQTEVEAEVVINNEKVLADQTGGFKQEISLHDGVNTISIISQKKYSRKNIKEIKVIVKKQ